MFSKILLATDGSEYALKAATVAAEVAKKFGATVIMLHVYTPVTHPIPSDSTAALDQDADIREVQDAVIGGTSRVLDKAGVAYSARREIGSPAEHIVGIAEQEDADLIALGSRGMSGVKAFLLGSVSDHVAHHAHCPVLIVR